jgi:hypothetical protein
MQSIRGVGYDVATALADLIDNSIAARATTVSVSFLWDGPDSAVAILDDGEGMDRDGLERAMTLGSWSPTDARAIHDLGRFGLGLKTASLSQCSRLTVASRQRGGPLSALVWDLDLVSSSNDWLVHDELTPSESRLARQLDDRESGTLVIWSRLDRMPATSDSSGSLDLLQFQRTAADVESHLAMVFHRYLEGRSPKLRLYVNGNDDEQRVKPWDPFCLDSPATQVLGEARRFLDGSAVVLQGHVLPHKDRFPTSDSFERAAGPAGWTAQQGFYVYRNGRLLVPGSWLGLGVPRKWTRDEQHKLARIRLDITNALDVSWAIDVKKSKADPPIALRDWLTRNAQQVRSSAREVFVHRGGGGSSPTNGQFTPMWFAEGGTAPRYRVNRDHPAVASILADRAPSRSKLESLVRLLESTVPIHRIWLDVAEKPEVSPPTSQQLPNDLVESLGKELLARLMSGHAMTKSEAMKRLRLMEPFDQFPAVLASLDHE